MLQSIWMSFMTHFRFKNGNLQLTLNMAKCTCYNFGLEMVYPDLLRNRAMDPQPLFSSKKKCNI